MDQKRHAHRPHTPPRSSDVIALSARPHLRFLPHHAGYSIFLADTRSPAPSAALAALRLLGIVILNLVSGWAIFRWSMRDLRASVVQAAQ